MLRQMVCPIKKFLHPFQPLDGLLAWNQDMEMVYLPSLLVEPVKVRRLETVGSSNF